MSHSTTAARNSGASASSAACRSGSSRVVIDLLRVRLVGRHPVVVLGQRLHADAAAAADHVEEQVRGDAVQPALEGARLVVLQRAEDADEGLLREILGVVLVAGQAVGEAVDPVGVLAHQLVPGRHGGPVAGGIERRGAGQLVGRLYPIPVGVLLDVCHGHGGQLRCGRQILLVTAAITHRRLDVDGNALAHMVIPITPASAVFHASNRLRPGCGWHMSNLIIS